MYFFLDKGRHPFYDPKNDDSTSFKIKLASPKWTFPSHFSAYVIFFDSFRLKFQVLQDRK